MPRRRGGSGKEILMKNVIAACAVVALILIGPAAAGACVIHSDLTLTLGIGGASGDYSVPSSGGGGNHDLIDKLGGTKSVENAWLEPVGNLRELSQFAKLDVVVKTGHPVLEYMALDGATPGA